MTSTERKLDEARYFLDQLDINEPYFDYILSAFLNAARSTTWIMRYEFQNVEGWEDWFNDSNVSENDRNLLRTINDLRIETAKKSGVKTDYYFFSELLLVDEKYYSVVKELLSKDGEYTLTMTPLDEVNEEGFKEENDTFRLIVNKDSTREKSSDRERLTALCTAYFAFLQTKVKDCVHRFK